jgi:hypothetical protein
MKFKLIAAVDVGIIKPAVLLMASPVAPACRQTGRTLVQEEDSELDYL